MSYFGFHLRFNAPLLALLLLLSGNSFFAGGSLPAAGWVLLAVFLFTIPWDNYAAACGIWGFPKGRYSFKIGFLPVEEYLFFGIQSLQAMLLCRFLCDRFPDIATTIPPQASGSVWPGALTLIVAWAVTGIFLRRRIAPRFHYAWHLLYWFLPVIGLQWIIGGWILLPRIGILASVTLLLGSLLSAADYAAIRSGIWWVDPGQTTGSRIGAHLPWEEAAFFYLTSLLVAQSYLLLVPESLR